MEKFIVRVTYHINKKDFEIHYFEVNKINEHDLLSNIKKIYKHYHYLDVRIISFQKMSYKELYQFNLGAYKKLFPDNIKVMSFKAPNETYFTVDKEIKSNQHELNYIRYMEDKGFKHVGTVDKIYNHNLN